TSEATSRLPWREDGHPAVLESNVAGAVDCMNLRGNLREINSNTSNLVHGVSSWKGDHGVFLMAYHRSENYKIEK
ncbi:hypothetical protein, partial [Burkholderia pseudomallei]|uniref:hypothetical protein n=1 Tax=Burkholderia pseudomallei TaxID=28450 RepID=UPI0015E0BAC7